MQQEAVQTNVKSKKCNPVEAGLYKFKARKLDSGILYSVHVFPKKLPEKPPTGSICFDSEMEKRIKQRKAERVLEDKHFAFMRSLTLLASCSALLRRKKLHSPTPGLRPLLGRREPNTHPRRRGQAAASSDKGPNNGPMLEHL
ncbi:hypothetical protein MJG53_018437 [Ovis ammon polii x Ovis aries]|uniref:TPX2 central domain-containing protein n=3 Tax=Ovis TaxID=9935 RepID=A0A835ZKH6_SHEEP|nr:hypothetical protein JEQ12_012799 [Ovis aries]KAI4532070.1 hypothetical protein MG293_018584 [Ovis ammon polii]KAI4551894.1 hypothetical protein MJT46_018146 [Ovis ammon polii x Ovis aries]KAI4559911.1 hypothetical protein MJG53_018437 [Ovis ammon polii x Ovis aries]